MTNRSISLEDFHENDVFSFIAILKKSQLDSSYEIDEDAMKSNISNDSSEKKIETKDEVLKEVANSSLGFINKTDAETCTVLGRYLSRNKKRI